MKRSVTFLYNPDCAEARVSGGRHVAADYHAAGHIIAPLHCGDARLPQATRPGQSPTARMILEEAYRPVTIREGENLLELPAIQAVMRAMGVAAMKGNRLAQKTLAEIVQKIEAEESAQRTSAFENALEYKIQWEREIERCRRTGVPEPSPLPHPDDILINMRTGTVVTAGPTSKEEKVEWDKRIERRSEAQSEARSAACILGLP